MISIAHSPDSDDYFMFWALRTGLVPGIDEEISFTPLGTEELNQRACQAQFDVTAASVGVLPYVCNDYDVLTHGASVGRGYGPRLVSKVDASLDSLRGKLIGIPGARTTAALVLGLILPDAKFIEVPIQPFNLIFDKLESHEIDAALLIHEGQFYFDSSRYHQILDIGQWWQQEYQLPLPLGVNLIKKTIDPKLKQNISDVISKSIRYGVEHIDDALPYLHDIAKQSNGPKLTDAKLAHYLDSYANRDSLMIDDACKKAIAILTNHGLIRRGLDNDSVAVSYQD